jgi:hypothetical protein
LDKLLSHDLKPRPAQPDWPEVLTDWCAIRALVQSGMPPILQNSGEVQAAFVAEVSAYLRFRALHQREAQVAALLEAATGTADKATVGSPYREVSGAVEATHGTFTGHRTRCLHESRVTAGTADHEEHSAGVCVRLPKRERQFDAYPRRLEPAARSARRRAAESYWAAVAQCRIPEDFFRDAPRDSALAEMPNHCATWWGLFVRWLGRVVARSNPAYCRLLQVLPQLQADAARPGQILTLAGLVEEWREANAERFGLLQEIHFPVLEQRAFAKHRFVTKWFEARAPGYKTDSIFREAAARRLYLRFERGSSEGFQNYWNN